MDAKKLAKAAKPAKLGDYLHRSAGHHVHHDVPSRETIHNGHKIVVQTIYRVTVDGAEVDLGLMVDDEGRVHCHSVPVYQFESALDMVKAIIDQFPDDFKKGRRRAKRPGGHQKAAKRNGLTRKIKRGKLP